MRQIFPRLLFAAIFLLSSALPGNPSFQAAAPGSPGATRQPVVGGFAADRVIVKLHPSLATESVVAAGAATGRQAFENFVPGVQVRQAHALFPASPRTAQVIDDPLEGIFLLELAPGSDVMQAVQGFSANAAVEWAEPDYLAYPTATTPNDPLFSLQWGLSQIDAPTAWDISTGAGTVPIALLDSGLQFNHPDLAGKLWVNPGEVPGNGLDDDNNGFIDDVNGWDFVNGDNMPADDNGHGTQTAGVAGAASNNSTGIAGVCWNCTLMPVKVMGAGGVANYSDIAAGVLYAARKGARVINISLGGYSESAALQAAILSAVETYGSVVVAGAGNDHLSTPFYPAAYPQVLAVAASGPGDILWGDSNYGEWVDVVAPGADIHTTFLGGDYGAVHGTSLSTAFVSGVAGLLRSHYPDWSADMVRAQITHTAQNIDSLNPGFAGLLGSGRVNAYQSLSIPPQPLLSFHSQTVNGSATVRPEPGSSVDLVVSVYNDWADAARVQGTLSSSSPYISITTASAAYGNIPAYATSANATPFQFTISGSAPFGSSLSLNLRLTASGGYVVDIPINVQTASAVVYPPATITTQTWTNDRVYVINKDSGIPVGNTLTIESGTEVRFVGDYTFTVQGTLIADGTPDQPIQIYNNSGYGRIVFADSSIDAVFDEHDNYLSGSILRHAFVDSIRRLDFDSSAPFISNNQFVDLSYGIYGRSDEGFLFHQNEVLRSVINICGSGTIYGNYIHRGNEVNPNGNGLIILGTFEVIANTVLNAGVGITIVETSEIILRNNLLATNSTGLIIYGGNNTVFNNTFHSNSNGPISIQGTSLLTIQHNNLLWDWNQYAIQITVPNPLEPVIDATLNWWGSTDPDEISAAIYDGMDQYGLGIINFEPFLTAPESNAPAYATGVDILPDTTLGIQTATFDISFNREMEPGTVPEIRFQSVKHDTQSYYWTGNSGLPSDYIRSSTIGSDGVVWFGTSEGAARFDGENWTTYQPSNDGMPGGEVKAIAIAPNGAVWFGTIGGGAARFDGENWTNYRPYNSGLPGWEVLDIAIAHDGTVWFGTLDGVGKYDGLEWTIYNSENSGLPSGDITAVEVDPSGSIWFGSYGGGAANFDGQTWKVYNTTNSDLPDDRVSDIVITPNGVKWLATAVGVTSLDENDVMETKTIGVNSMSVAPDGLVWFGYESNIWQFDGNNWEIVYLCEEEPSNCSILNIGFSSKGPIWFGTNFGVYVWWSYPTYTPDRNTSYWLDNNTYRATLEITSLIPRDDYLVHVSDAVGTDGIEMAPTLGFPFTVDYAGAISDTTPPDEPIVELCAGTSVGNLSAIWTAYDPQSSINLYSYAIGTNPGGSNVVDWTSTTATSFSRTNLNLTAGQTYYVAVKARNAGGLWSEAGIPPGVVAGSGVCTINNRQLFLPMIKD
jgi:hypothetical protein